MRSLSVPFSDLPHQSKLFIDYLRDPRSLKRFYPNAAAYTDLDKYVPKVLANYKTDRQALCDALNEINSECGASEETFENIDRLRLDDAVAVVTGQQAGLFTGPLYTIYKALTTIRMSEEMNVAGYTAVPIFWVATEDHDFDEVSRTFFIGGDGELFDAKYQPKGQIKSLPVGGLRLGASIAELIDTTFDALSKTEFSDDVRHLIESSWCHDAFYGKAFSRNLASIFRKYGLIVIDPMHAGIKALVAPVYADAIERSAEIVANIRTKSSELVAEGYHAQVLVEEDYFPLFRIDDKGRRVALRRTGNGVYGSKEEKREFTIEELAALAMREPTRFSPGVMLRPVVQDYLLPTVCYFGGAAEIAYFAQNGEAYEVLGRPVTPILHRQSFTIIDARSRRSLDKYKLDLKDMFDAFDTVLERIGMNELSAETDTLLTASEERMNSYLDKLHDNFRQIDPTLAENLAKRRRKIMYHLAVLRKKANLAVVRKDETVERQLRLAFNCLVPNGLLQERVLNVHSFLNKYGEHFIDTVYAAVDLSNMDHRVIDL